MINLTERCSRGCIKSFCCTLGAIDNLRAYWGKAWVYHFEDACPDERVVMVATAAGMDPHDLLDALEKRGWESHDKHFVAEVLWEAAVTLRPELRETD